MPVTDDAYTKASLVDNPLAPLCRAWWKLTCRAKEWKDAEFQQDADDIMMFFNGTKDDFFDAKWAQGPRGYAKKGGDVPQPDFQMVLMRPADAVQIINPALYANNPTIEVTPIRFPEIYPAGLGIDERQLQPQQGPDGQMIPTPVGQRYEALQMHEQRMEQIRHCKAAVHKELLNYGQRELNKREHMRSIIDEALLMGAGVGWTELDEPPGGGRRIGTFYESVRTLLIDPDADHWDDVQWISRERCMPYWEAEEKFSLPKGSLEKYCRKETVAQQEMADGSDDTKGSDRKTGKTNDLITFREIYSKMGIGDRLKGVPDDLEDELLAKGLDNFDWDEVFGQHCYLAVAPNCPWPLNLHPSKWDKPPKELKLEAEWPIPFWLDNEWPCTVLAFHPVPGQVWPMSHFKPGMGELKWLTWAYSFLANKVRTSCGTIIGVKADAADEIVPALESGSDNKIVKITQSMEGRSIKDFIDYTQQPAFHGDIYTVIQAVMNEYDKRIGLSEILYGMSGATQDRSATESNIKQQNASGRINDMAHAVESTLSKMCRKEALANRWFLDRPEYVADVLGPQGTHVWITHVIQEPVDRVVREYDFKIVAGSARKQDKQTKLETLMEFARNWGPMLQAGMSMGMLDPVNNLMVDTAKLMDMDQPERYLFVPPPPQPPPPDPKAEADLQKTQLEMQQNQEQHQMDMQMRIAEMQMKREEALLKQQEMQAKLVFEQQKNEMQLAIMREKAQMEFAIEQQKAQQTLVVEQAKAQQQIETEQIKAQSQQQLESKKAETQLAVEKQKADASIATQKEMTKAKVEQTKATGKAQAEAAKLKAKATPKKPSGDKK